MTIGSQTRKHADYTPGSAEQRLAAASQAKSHAFLLFSIHLFPAAAVLSNIAQVTLISTPLTAICETEDCGGFPRHRSTAGQLPDCGLDQYRGLPKERFSWKPAMSCKVRFSADIPARTSSIHLSSETAKGIIPLQ